MAGAITKSSPPGRKKCSLVIDLPQGCKQTHGLVRRLNMVSVQPLDVVLLAKFQGMVARRGSVLVLRRDSHNLSFLRQSARNIVRVVKGPVVPTNDFFARPSLSGCARDRVYDSILRVVGGNQHGNQGIHAGRQ